MNAISATLNQHPSQSQAVAFQIVVEKTRTNIADLAKQQTTGMALIAWSHTEDDFFIDSVWEFNPLFEQKVDECACETMHYLGFLYSLYAVALFKLTGKIRHRNPGVRAAKVLANGFIPEDGYICAWGRMDQKDADWDEMAIIDGMMNLSLLIVDWRRSTHVN